MPLEESPHREPAVMDHNGSGDVLEFPARALPAIAELAVFGNSQVLVKTAYPEKLFPGSYQVCGPEKIEIALPRLLEIEDYPYKYLTHF